MSDDVVFETPLLKGESLSIGGSRPVLSGALALWAAPALLLAKFSPDAGLAAVADVRCTHHSPTF